MTLHDYFLLCPTLKLIDYNQCFCYHDNLDYACAVCCQNAHTNKNNLIKSTISYHLNRNSVLHRIVPLMVKFKNSIKRTETAPIPALKSNAEYQKRRNVNLSRMDKIDLLVAQSHKVEAIYRCFLKNKKIITLHSTVSHLSSIEPKKMEKLTGKVSFCTLNGFASIPKGSLILKKALDLLNERGLKDQFHFHIWGGLDPEFETVKDWENVTYHGTYQVDDLNQNLELIEVGVVPSIWEEIYGYVGLEFLAKGIPVIGNNKGGIIDYTIKNFTGWINKSSSPEELANIMELIITDPSLINKLNKKIVENRWNLIKNMNDHFEEIKAIYSSLIN